MALFRMTFFFLCSFLSFSSGVVTNKSFGANDPTATILGATLELLGVSIELVGASLEITDATLEMIGATMEPLGAILELVVAS